MGFIDSLYRALGVIPFEINPPLSHKWQKKYRWIKIDLYTVQLPNRTLVGFTFWTFRPIDHNHPHGENSVAAITFPEKYVHLILHLFMDIYVPPFYTAGIPECWKFPNPLKKGNNIFGKKWWGPRPVPLCKMTMQCVFFTFDVINFCSSTQSRFFNFIHRYFSEI